MALPARLMRSRIKSVRNTRKITKAMELVSSAKMRKAVVAVVASRPYAQIAWQTALTFLAKLPEGVAHPLLAKRAEVRKTLVVVFSGDKGLCGGYNSQVLRVAEQYIKRISGALEIAAVGKRGSLFFRSRPESLKHVFTGFSNAPTFKELRTVGKIAVDGFLAGQYDAVTLVYTDFRSALVQKPNIVKMLPIEEGVIDEIGELAGGKVPEEKLAEAAKHTEFLIEPDPMLVLDAILPRILEARLYQALLESNASEHSARMMSMKNATSAANDMIEDLTLTMNQARQASITREISEISAGKAALE